MKKFYKNTFVQLILAMFVFGFVACQEYEIESQPELPLNIQIDALDSYTALATSPSNVVFNISSNTPWSISCDQQWCKVTPSMSASSSLVSEIVVSMENNETSQSRTATLTINAENVSGSKVITINQVSKEKLVVVPFDGLVASEGETISFTLVSNKPWEIIPSTGFLGNIDKKSGEGSEDGKEEVISITVPSNPGAKRSGEITVKTEFEEYTFAINQNGVIIEIEDNPESLITLGGGNGYDLVTSSVVIRANQDWKVEVPEEYQDWLSAEAISATELKISAKTNNRLAPRTGKLIMKTKELIDGFDGVEFTVQQNIAFWFNQGPQNREVDAATGNVKMLFVAGNNFASNYPIKKGRICFEFEEINLTGASRLVFNMWPNAGNTNFHFWLRSDAATQFTCGGAGFAWQQLKPTFTVDEVNAIKKIEFFVEDDPDNAGKLRIRLCIDGVDKGILANKNNPYLSGAATEPGQIINVQAQGTPDAGNYYIIKSVTYEPYEL